MPPPSSLLLSLKSPIQIPSLPASLSPFQAKRHPPPSPFPKPFFPSSFSPLAATPTSFPYSFSPNPFQNPNQDDREIPSLGGGDDDEDDEIVVGDCLVFEEGAFEDGDPFPTPETGREVERPRRRKPAAKKADSALEHENLVPEKWKEVVEEINLTKKEKRKISHQLKFGSRLERRKPPRLPDMEEYRAYREMKLSQLNPVVLDNPREFSPEKEAVVPPEPEGGRVVPRNPRLEMGGGTLEDITDFFNSGDYVPGAIDDDKMPQGRRKLFTKDEKVLLNKRIPNLAEATSSKWPIYGLTIMCDGWTGPTRRSINFLTYCDAKTFFHKSVDASAYVHNIAYMLKLMEDVIDLVGEENVVQVVTDDGPQYKAAGQVLMERRPHIFRTPCAAHCIDLMLMDIGKIRRVQQTVETAQYITRYIYNHNWVLSLMRKSAGGEILRPGVIRFATNFIALDSIPEKRGALCQIFASPEWYDSRYSYDGTEGR
ncbi:uncharacterized protein LOC120110891 isoform X1 [Phoenix dactylifera]|uniref:Uncharacterized protein LOC120110891 isoform X1 n=1 Tax=Phoenix dactylifera TaxID=42345 RepID=A0A8B9A7V7_PHODC|nr:uncharacterized protein LOC120110891 isoform X1 [Phoenix dactylifera]